MPRIRSLKPEFATHRKVGRLSIAARWLWLVTLSQSDDEGRFVADPGQLRVQAFAYDLDMTDTKVGELLNEIAATGLIRCYVVRNVPYGCFPSWRDHQRIDRPTPSKLPPPPELRSTRARRVVGEPSTRTRGGSEGIGEERKGSEGGDRTGKGNHTAGDTPAPPIAHAFSNSNGKPKATPAGNETTRTKPPRGLYQEILANLERLYPDLPKAEREDRALKDYEEATRR